MKSNVSTPTPPDDLARTLRGTAVLLALVAIITALLSRWYLLQGLAAGWINVEIYAIFARTLTRTVTPATLIWPTMRLMMMLAALWATIEVLGVQGSAILIGILIALACLVLSAIFITIYGPPRTLADTNPE